MPHYPILHGPSLTPSLSEAEVIKGVIQQVRKRGSYLKKCYWNALVTLMVHLLSLTSLLKQTGLSSSAFVKRKCHQGRSSLLQSLLLSKPLVAMPPAKG